MSDHDHDVSDGSVWIRSHPDENGHYNLVLELGPDDVVPLDAASAYGWAREVLSAVAAAEYDAAILRQADHLGLEKAAAVMLVQEVRADRAEKVPLSMIPGLSMTPGVSAKTRNGFIQFNRNGEAIGQWDMDAAREHVLALLTSVEVAIMDSAYARALIKLGLDQPRALAAVDDLGQHRGEG